MTETSVAVKEESKRKMQCVSGDINYILPFLKWMLRARGDKFGPPSLMCIFADQYGWTCTDGKRLHHYQYEHEGQPILDMQGLYSVEFVKKQGTAQTIFAPQDGDYPDYRRIIPKDYVEWPIMLQLKHKQDSKSLSIALARIITGPLKGKSVIDYSYLKDLGGYDWLIFTAKRHPYNQSIMFVSGRCMAIVMPIELR